VKFRRKENAVEGVLECRRSSSARVGGSVMADVLCSFLQALTRWERAFFNLCFCFVAPLGFLGVFARRCYCLRCV
jgi:hypothetical protein